VKLPNLKALTLCLCLLACTAWSAFAQHGGGGGGGQHGPGGGGPGGFGVPGGGSSSNGRNGPPPFSTGNPTGNVSAPRSGLQVGPIGRWWDDRKVAQSIGLRKDQQKRMDSIFKANKPALLESYKALEREKARLNTMTRQRQVDKASMFAGIDSVSQARAALEKANTELLLQIRQELDPDQIEKLEKLR
jgi:Spy/CpxP family protein refolding chaperone